MSILLAAAMLLAAPEDCSPALVIDAYNDRKWAKAESIALRCASKEEPNYYFYAAQAQGERRRWSDQRRSLKMFLQRVSKIHPHRTEAEEMLAECEKRLVKPTPPKPTDEGPPGDPGPAKDIDSPPTDETPPTESGDTSDGAGAETSEAKKPGPNDPEPEDIEGPKRDETPTPQRDPRRRGLWIGIGAVGGGAVLVGAATGIAGLGGTRRARDKNDELLDDSGLPAQFDPAKGTPEQLAKAEQLESDYPANTYYSELLGGLRRESVGTIVGAAGVGLVLGALPELGRSERRRRAGFVALLSAGALVVTGGATWMSFVHASIRESLGGYDENTNPDGWRAGGPVYDELRRKYLLSAGLAGLGIGLVLGGATGALVRWHDRPARGDQMALRVVPTFNGLMLTGRF